MKKNDKQTKAETRYVGVRMWSENYDVLQKLAEETGLSVSAVLNRFLRVAIRNKQGFANI